MQHESKLLGKTITYPDSYCPEILVAVPRSLNREIYGISKAEQLFCGYDSWHAYEIGFILDNGMPVVGLLKIVYPSTSPFIVESKSLKLYLGSYNMTSMGKDKASAIGHFVQQVEQDLGKLLSTQVQACFYPDLPAYTPFDFGEYQILEDQICPEHIQFSIYQEHPAYLHADIRYGLQELKVGSHLLKSNCKITNQPDWGSIYIHMRASSLPAETSLLKYIVSLRNENHFHEEICEMTYKRLSDIFQPEVLHVSCLYTRRGGIDICPSRTNRPEYLPEYLPQAKILTQRTFRQ